MPDHTTDPPRDPAIEQARREGAAAEREAVLEIIESHARRLSHGHGATGAQVLQSIVDQITSRGNE